MSTIRRIYCDPPVNGVAEHYHMLTDAEEAMEKRSDFDAQIGPAVQEVLAGYGDRRASATIDSYDGRLCILVKVLTDA